MRILVTILLCLWMNVGYASPNWEVYDEYTWIDTSSIKVIQVDYDELVKVNTKSSTKNGGWTLMTMVINKDTKWWAASVMENYNADGTLRSKYTNNIKDRRWWMDGTKDKMIDTVINRVP